MNNSDFTFGYSTSTCPYDRNKDSKNTSKLTWEEKRGTVRDLANDIKNGYAFCPTFYHDGSAFGMSAKNQVNLKSSNFIVFDFDAVKLPAGEFYGKTIATDLTPSIIYTTANDGVFKDGKNETFCNRYRVIYVVDDPITMAETYTEIHQALKADIATYVGDNNIYNDNTDKDVAHFFAGCKNTELYCNNTVISLVGLCNRYNVVVSDTASAYSAKTNNLIEDKSAKPFPCVDIKEEEKYYTTRGNIIALFKDFYNDFLSRQKSIYDLVREYSGILPLLPEETPVEYDPDKLYKVVEENHIRIVRRRHKVTKRDARGNEYEAWETVKFKDGQRRHEILYKNLQMVKAITPTATREQLLWQGLNFVCRDLDNTKQPITKSQVSNTVEQVMSREWKPSEISKQKYKVTIAVDKELAAQKGIKRRYSGLAAAHEWKTDEKMKKWEKIATYYDPTKTDKDNVKIMNDAGISVTVQYLRKWKCKNGYSGKGKQSKSEQIALYYDPSLTDGQNLEQLAANGVGISLRTLQTWKAANGYTKSKKKTDNEFIVSAAFETQKSNCEISSHDAALNPDL